jgi:hypothetical protein
MEFIKKTEHFFIQLKYCLSIEPETVLFCENGYVSLILEPEIFFKLIHDFNLEYPFNAENKIIELKWLLSTEKINTNDALKIIENFKNQYWLLDTITFFEPLTDKLKNTLKSINSEITESEINIELIRFNNHYQAIRQKIYSDLIHEIESLTFHSNLDSISNFNIAFKEAKSVQDNEIIPYIRFQLHDFQYNFSPSDYCRIVEAMVGFIKNGTFPKCSQPLMDHLGKFNKKKIGWTINMILANYNKRVDFKVLQFFKENFTMFNKYELEENNFRNSNLYKYFTTNTDEN